MGLTRDEALKILGLEEGCTERDIRERFKKLALKWHPDKNVQDPEEAQKKFQLISAAHTKLIDPSSPEDDALDRLFAEVWERKTRSHLHRPHKFCDYDDCQGDWDGHRYREFDDSDDDIYYYRDKFYADSLLKQFADKLYRNYNGPGRPRKTKGSGWQDTPGYGRTHVSAEEATKHADELLKAEEEEKKEAEKRRTKNKKKKEAKKRRKAKQQSRGKSGKRGGGSKEPVKVQEDEEDSEDMNSDSEEDQEGVKAEGEVYSGEELDFDSAFIARVREKQAQQKTKNRTVTAHAPPTPMPPDEEQLAQGTLEQTNGSGTRQPFKHQPQKQKSSSEYSPSSDRGAFMNGNTGQSCPSASFAAAGTLNSGTADESAQFSESSAPPLNLKEASAYEPNIGQSRQQAGQGNRAAKEGRFQEAVASYSEAIELYPFDHRYYGNRSYCYDYLAEFKEALKDASTALYLEPLWPKGHFRKARALAGLKRYVEAEQAYTRAVELDPNYKDAQDELLRTKVERMKTMGFPTGVCESALRQHGTVQAAVEAILSGNAAPQTTTHRPSPTRSPPSHRVYAPVYNSSGFELPPRMLAKQQPQDANSEGRALWVGNVNAETITHKMLTNLFKQCGDMQSVRVLPDRHCAFVNYSTRRGAIQAMRKLQGHHIGGCCLLLRYPENPVKGTGDTAGVTRNVPSREKIEKKSGPINGDECYFWRTTGCTYGASCHYKHIPAHEGIDLTEGMIKGLGKQRS